jgi:hypothetical protein
MFSSLAARPALTHRGPGMAARRERRTQARVHEKLVREMERLARLQPGGNAERPIMVDSPAVVDIRAVANPCPLCGGSLRLDEHSAREIDGEHLRVAAVSCVQCGVRRSLYFRVSTPAVH